MAKKIFTDFDFQSVSKVINLPSPSSSGDAVSKSYVDSLVEGLAWKDSCRVATQANLNLSSPGATIDGITMASQDRVLVRAQSTAADNGIYVWNGASTPMTRSLDASTFDELEQAISTVEQGTSAFLTWEFRFRMKRFDTATTQVIRGATHLRFAADGRVAMHRDYWDAAEELYEKLPVLGALMRWLRRQAG